MPNCNSSETGCLVTTVFSGAAILGVKLAKVGGEEPCGNRLV